MDEEPVTRSCQLCKDLSLKLHMDGSRIFNASIATGLSVKEIANGFDTVTICLSKGLGCPMGALLAFNSEDDYPLRRLKHLMGGAMRQSGIMAAAGVYALQNQVERLERDHKNAKLLSEELNKIHSIEIINNPPDTNIVLFKLISDKISINEFHDKCAAKGLRFSSIGNNVFRAVTHLNISEENIMNTISIIKDFIS